MGGEGTRSVKELRADFDILDCLIYKNYILYVINDEITEEIWF